VQDLETMIVTAKGAGSVTVSVTGTGKTGTSLLIIIDTKTVTHHMMMNGRGDDLLGLAANHDYQHMRRNIILEKNLIMERGGGLPPINIKCCLFYLSIFVEGKNSNKKIWICHCCLNSLAVHLWFRSC
jgi:hypothetical protein